MINLREIRAARCGSVKIEIISFGRSVDHEVLKLWEMKEKNHFEIHNDKAILGLMNLEIPNDTTCDRWWIRRIHFLASNVQKISLSSAATMHQLPWQNHWHMACYVVRSYPPPHFLSIQPESISQVFKEKSLSSKLRLFSGFYYSFLLLRSTTKSTKPLSW